MPCVVVSDNITKVCAHITRASVISERNADKVRPFASSGRTPNARQHAAFIQRMGHPSEVASQMATCTRKACGERSSGQRACPCHSGCQGGS